MNVSDPSQTPDALHDVRHRRLVLRLSFQILLLHLLKLVEYLVVPILRVIKQFHGLRERFVPLSEPVQTLFEGHNSL